MNGALAWVLVALGLGVIGVRRRSVAVALLTVQALILAGIALHDAANGGDVASAFALGLRALGLGALFAILVRRTRTEFSVWTSRFSDVWISPGASWNVRWSLIPNQRMVTTVWGACCTKKASMDLRQNTWSGLRRFDPRM